MDKCFIISNKRKFTVHNKLEYKRKFLHFYYDCDGDVQALHTHHVPFYVDHQNMAEVDKAIIIKVRRMADSEVDMVIIGVEE